MQGHRVLMNAGAAIYVGGGPRDLRAGIEHAASSIDSGCALARLDALVRLRGVQHDTGRDYPEIRKTGGHASGNISGADRHAFMQVSRPRSGTENGKNAVIAEIKCASPSRGIIRRNVDMAQMAGVLAEGGCVALSVLTEPYFFGGTGQDIARVKSAVNLPVLRKDFIIDERQLAESVGARGRCRAPDCCCARKRLPVFVDRAADYGLEPLVEVHNQAEVACCSCIRMPRSSVSTTATSRR